MAGTIGRYQADEHATQGVSPSPQPPAQRPAPPRRAGNRGIASAGLAVRSPGYSAITVAIAAAIAISEGPAGALV